MWLPGRGGGTLTIKGTNFSSSGNIVKVGGQSCTIIKESTNNLQCNIPPNKEPNKFGKVDLEVINKTKRKALIEKSLII